MQQSGGYDSWTKNCAKSIKQFQINFRAEKYSEKHFQDVLKSFKSRIDQAEERICELRDGSLKLSSQSWENMNENREKVYDLWNMNKKSMHCGKQMKRTLQNTKDTKEPKRSP